MHAIIQQREAHHGWRENLNNTDVWYTQQENHDDDDDDDDDQDRVNGLTCLGGSVCRMDGWWWSWWWW